MIGCKMRKVRIKDCSGRFSGGLLALASTGYRGMGSQSPVFMLCILSVLDGWELVMQRLAFKRLEDQLSLVSKS